MIQTYASRCSSLSVVAVAAVVSALFIALTFVPLSVRAQTDDYSDMTGTVAAYCPNLSVTMQRGARDASTSGQVSELQKFLSGYYDIDPEELVTGFFGRITQGYVQRFQAEQVLPAYGIAGSLTRARIASLCGGSDSGAVNFTVSPISGTIPLTVTFSANLQAYSSSGTGDIVLDYGDGQSGTLCRPGFSGVSACAAWSGSHAYTTAGTYVAQLIKKGGTCSVNNVSTSCGAPDQIIGTVMIVASATSGNEILSASPISGSAPLTVQFTMEKLNLQGMGTKTYYLDFGDGSSIHTTNSIGKDGEIHVYTKAGSYVATLSVSKDCPPGYGCPAVLENLASVTISVSSGTSDVPVISGVSGPTTLAIGQTGTWMVQASDPGSSALSYSVRWGDENVPDSLQSIAGGSAAFVQSASFTHTYSKVGTYMPHFTVRNAAGKTTESSVSVQVGGSVTSGNLAAAPSSGAAPLAVTFGYEIGTAAVTVENYRLDFGDGSSGTPTIGCGIYTSGLNVCARSLTWSHSYTHVGTYTASLYSSGGCFTSSDSTACYDQKLIGTAVVTVSSSSTGGGGTSCSSGYYLSVTGSCLPSTSQISNGGQAVPPACAAGYYMTIGNGCQPKTDSAASASTAVASCAAGSYMAMSGCMPLPAGSCSTTWGSRLVGNNEAVSMQPYFTNGIYTGSEIRYLCQSGTWRTQGYCGDASGPDCQKP